MPVDTDATVNSFRPVFEALRLDAKSLQLPVDATFIPPRPASEGDASLNSLPRLVVTADLGHGTGADLSIVGLIGEGGRGEVHTARQVPLRRDVAVKSLKGPRDSLLVQELLREARITGGLEHPNIVPIYALGRDEQDRVLLVMRKLGGVPWGRILRTEGPARTEAQIERHLEILIQVCRAVEYAHQRGFVHRDLKPENIIVGSFGEVVVLDWGLAVCLAGDADLELPPASELKGLAGTPAYMSPELVSGDGALIGRWTDVYLLGAILHEVFTGAPPHRGGQLEEVLQRAHLSAPQVYGPDVPTEVAEVCNRAMAREPQHRYGSVTLFREALRDVGHHRQSAQLAAESRRLLANPDRAALAQARFGFEQALRMWTDNASAQLGLREVREGVLELEIADRNLAGVERLLAELKDVRAEVMAKVEALRRDEAQRGAELERLRRDEHERAPEVTEGPRNRWFIITAVLWFVVPLWGDWVERTGRHHLTARDMLIGIAFFFVFTVVGLWLLTPGNLQNQMGRRLTLSFVALVGVVGLLRISVTMLPIPPLVTFVPEMFLYGLASALVALLVDARFAIPAVVYLAAGLLAAALPDQILRVVAAANLLGLLPMALLWKRLEPKCKDGERGLLRIAPRA